MARLFSRKSVVPAVEDANDLLGDALKQAQASIVQRRVELPPDVLAKLKAWIEIEKARQALEVSLKHMAERADKLEKEPISGDKAVTLLSIVRGSSGQAIQVGVIDVVKYTSKENGLRVSYSKVVAEVVQQVDKETKDIILKKVEAHRGASKIGESLKLDVVKAVVA